MLSKEEVRERALYCYSVFLQLSWLYSNNFIAPTQYIDSLKESSLGLGEDEFITLTIKEALMEEREDGGLRTLMALYEGFAGAFCEVLEISLDDIHAELSPEYCRQLASEVGVDLNRIEKVLNSP
ncbi:MAG TPA: hypothetical protein P5244_08595 [Syntrophales bacterium]|nr:hypothetical protein [Syntrophales bacterium]HRT27745.1 hypothetical protein [Syntrophales bacterium]HRT70511.1 hypothetical protein [Syntrophales bacterium]